MKDVATCQLMDAFCPLASTEEIDRLARVSAHEIEETLAFLGVTTEDRLEVRDHWSEFQASPDWMHRLASVLAMQNEQRGNPDAPSPIWDDMNVTTNGRLFYFYVVALDTAAALENFRRHNVPEHIITDSLSALRRHAAINRRVRGEAGVNAGWWLLLTLRGDLLHIGSLQYQLVHIGRGTFSPEPWYSAEEAASLGRGFQYDDESFGLHMPDGTDLSPQSIDRSLDEAREVLGALWPAQHRRLVTTQTWMLDDRLPSYLDASSNIVQFQRRFELVPHFHDDDFNVREFVFRDTETPLEQLAASSSVQRAVLEVLRTGGHWRDRAGWADFDQPK